MTYFIIIKMCIDDLFWGEYETVDEVKKELKEKLPKYYLPKTFVVEGKKIDISNMLR